MCWKRRRLPTRRPRAFPFSSTLYHRFIRWSGLGVFDRILTALAGEGPQPGHIMIDANTSEGPRTAASLLKKGMLPVVSGEPSAG
ncbi:hypothetical protein ELH53_30070 (plasmid) [Rhizobium ruizarguesonis]|nr:hypothetical protein [Rhizobium leguminosarum bv. viciae]TAY85116.1 hypothetical protein ELH85_31255 [Rhizobium ruizarguesonis]NKL39838.1 hypothetical protein [Rhizobium leguminosarum bv. viciae]TBA10956.1 hypothetical protein ELH65_31275 [Rhizobium ruizarguesonis]TBA11860.1 hypothetical protein ELH66_27530 [Rhizobium ruizarguesonis]